MYVRAKRGMRLGVSWRAQAQQEVRHAKELDRTVERTGRRWRACAGTGDERTRQADVWQCRRACMHAEGRPGHKGAGARARGDGC
ncbi:hypothetical protein CDL15_Pgr023824 [Punica granatum]|uniref:Uncharacterized protein n=1 Tax=Punica granatum TaxID=22663 RepID=A0A218VYC8_PUNGR|nr:hypothetical protein CDL15_Pgr023824 [Punica granatum]